MDTLGTRINKCLLWGGANILLIVFFFANSFVGILLQESRNLYTVILKDAFSQNDTDSRLAMLYHDVFFNLFPL